MNHLMWMTSNHYAVLCITVDVLGSCLLLEFISYFLSHSFVEHLCMFIIVGAVSVFVNEKHPVRLYIETAYQEKLRVAVDKIQTVFEGKVITLQIENSKQKAILEHRENVHGRKECSGSSPRWVVNSESSKSASNTHARRHPSKSPVILPSDSAVARVTQHCMPPALGPYRNSIDLCTQSPVRAHSAPVVTGVTKHCLPPALGPYRKSIDLCTPSISLAGSSHTSQNSSGIIVERTPSSRSLDPYELSHETSLESQRRKLPVSWEATLKGNSEEILPLSRGL